MIKRQHMLSFQKKEKNMQKQKGCRGFMDEYYYLLIKEIIIMVNAMLWNYAKLHPKEQKRNQKRAIIHVCFVSVPSNVSVDSNNINPSFPQLF